MPKTLQKIQKMNLNKKKQITNRKKSFNNEKPDLYETLYKKEKPIETEFLLENIDDKTKLFKNHKEIIIPIETHKEKLIILKEKDINKDIKIKLDEKKTSKNSKSPTPSKNLQEEFSFTPLLSKKSLKIAEKLGNPMNRLTKESIIKTKDKINKLEEQLEKKYSYKPEINKLTDKILLKKDPVSHNNKDISFEKRKRWEDLLNWVK